MPNVITAAVPPEATTIHTPTDGLASGWDHIPVTGGSLPVYWARPDAEGLYPLVLVVQEIFGVHDHIADVCRRLAHLGYLAVAPELFFRRGDAKSIADFQVLQQQFVAPTPDAQVMTDLDNTLSWAGDAGGDIDRAGVTGFCWGGRIAWLYAAHNPRIKAGVAWYGKLDSERTPNQPRQPIDIVPDLRVPVLGLYGGNDQSIPLASIQAMQRAVTAASRPCDIHVYSDVGHAFNADYRQSFVPEAAENGWHRMQEWFNRHGAGATP